MISFLLIVMWRCEFLLDFKISTIRGVLNTITLLTAVGEMAAPVKNVVIS